VTAARVVVHLADTGAEVNLWDLIVGLILCSRVERAWAATAANPQVGRGFPREHLHENDSTVILAALLTAATIQCNLLLHQQIAQHWQQQQEQQQQHSNDSAPGMLSPCTALPCRPLLLPCSSSQTHFYVISILH
jgi:hypothetical protein